MMDILVVDDEEQVRQILKKILNSMGYRVTEAVNGVAALLLLETYHPDLILLDIHMPGLSGLEVLQNIQPLLGEIPVIMLTGDRDHETGQKSITLGARDYITKPLHFGQLKTTLSVHLIMQSDHTLSE